MSCIVHSPLPWPPNLPGCLSLAMVTVDSQNLVANDSSGKTDARLERQADKVDARKSHRTYSSTMVV